jgi:enamine deaminase RidA (YjgF/YER057c/UK114 family)
MTDKNVAAAAEPLLPVELGPGKIKFAQGMKAGRWVFATGVMAQDFRIGIAPEVLAENAPHSGAPKREKEALRIFENIDAVLSAAGTDRASLVRTDQYYTTVKPCRPTSRSAQFLRRIPLSTSIAQRRLLLPGADMNIQALGVIPAKGFRGHPPQARGARRTPDLRLFARGHGRRLHLHSRHHVARGRQRAAAERRGLSCADDRRARNGPAADQARDRVHHQGGWCNRWRWRRRR